MKIASLIVIFIGLGLAAFNAFKMNWAEPFAEESKVALIGIIASLCAVLLMVILRLSWKIRKVRAERKS